jgi:hypothetical protein
MRAAIMARAKSQASAMVTAGTLLVGPELLVAKGLAWGTRALGIGTRVARAESAAAAIGLRLRQLPAAIRDKVIMQASAQDGPINVVLDETEYLMILNGLRELIGEMHEKDFPPRVGATCDAVSALVMQLRDELEKLGIEE